jgi:uncharacterized protein (TIGR02611 family)
MAGDGDREGPHPLIGRLQERRSKHRERPRAMRVLFVVAGFTILGVGLAMLVLPGPALAVIPIGLALLALEFTWAERMLERAIDQAEKARRTASEASRAQRLVTAGAVALGVAAFVAWAALADVPLLPV